MDLLQLKYFVTAAEEGTISAAARRLNVSQPPLSVQIKNLEDECGMKLFNRGARHVSLTEGGELLYKYAVRMLEMKSSALNDIKNLKAGLRTSIKLGIISSGECGELLDGLSEFGKLYQDISFRIYDANTYELLNELEKGRIELAVVRTPYKTDDIEGVTLRKDSFVVAGKSELLGDYAGKTVKLQDVSGIPLIIYRRWQEIIKKEMDKCALTPHFICINDDARTSIQWAMAGIGAALVPESILPFCHELPYIKIDNDVLTSTVQLIRRTGVDISTEAECLFDFFKRRFIRCLQV